MLKFILLESVERLTSYNIADYGFIQRSTMHTGVCIHVSAFPLLADNLRIIYIYYIALVSCLDISVSSGYIGLYTSI